MLVSGIITCGLALAMVAPQFALQRMFGQTLEGPLAEVIVRSWGAMITLIGGMLIYGAFRPVHRDLVLVVASISKFILVGLILTIGSPYLNKAMVTVVFDGTISVVYVLYLVGSKSRRWRA